VLAPHVFVVFRQFDWRPALNDPRAEVLNHWVEVPTVVQEQMTFRQTECADDHVDRLAHRDTLRAQTPVVLGRLDRDLLAEHRCDRKLPKIPLDPSGMRLIARSSQHLRQDQVSDL
jgi:hypothetical protein